jgi:hypothetical protein
MVKTAAVPAKERAPKCDGSGQAFTAPGKAKPANGDRATCPVCGGSVGLAVSKRSGAVTYSTHYRKGHQEARGTGSRTSGRAKAAAEAPPPKGTPRAAVKAARKFITASGTEYPFTPAANGTEPGKVQGQVQIRDAKAGVLKFDVVVTDAGEASFRNNRQGRTVRGKLV